MIVDRNKAIHTINAEISTAGEARTINYSGVVDKMAVKVG
jgi:hypothetical protein